MKWLTLDYIKKHSRIDTDCEDSLLELYAEAAEDTILSICQRTSEDLMQVYGHIPAPIQQASLMLVDVSHEHRSPVSVTNMSMVPYTFDILIKPYICL